MSSHRSIALPTAILALPLLAGMAAATPNAGASGSLDNPPGLSAEHRAYACQQEALVAGPGRPPDPAGPQGRGHVPGFVASPAGDLLLSFDAGSRPLSRQYTTRMKPGDRTWSAPIRIDDAWAEGLHASLHNMVLFNDGEGRIHNFFTTIREGTSHGNSTLDYRYSDDDGHTWSTPVTLREEFGWLFGTRPFRMSNGEAIVPVYKERSPHGVGFMISDDNFGTFEVYPPAEQLWPGNGIGGIQAATVELDDGHLLAFIRTGADFIYRIESFDYGRTWTDATPTDLPNPWSRVDLLELDSGNLLLAYNPSSSDREPLALALSEDGGDTWSHEVEVVTGTEGAYPALWQASDGSIHVAYALRDSGAIGTVVFNEEFVRHGEDLPPEPQLDPQIVEYRNGKIHVGVNHCRYAWTRGIPPLAVEPG